jgi:hypothetical protein
MLNRYSPDRLLETVFLRDPDRVIPFKLNLEAPSERYLTGADLDPESIQGVGDLYWIGDEFGPYLVAVDWTGSVVRLVDTQVDGRGLFSWTWAISSPAAERVV